MELHGLDLNFARLRANLSQWQLGKQVDVPPYILSRAERGHLTLKPFQVERIRVALRRAEKRP